MRYVDPRDLRWRIDFVHADRPEKFDLRKRSKVLTAEDVKVEGVKDPYVFLVGGIYYMYISYDPSPLKVDEGLKRRITLISAPAGFGKTSLTVQWLNRIPGLSAWLSLDRNDSDPERFLRYVIAALRKTVPGLCAGVEGVLSAVQLPPPDYLADAMISDLSALAQPVVLVLDDFGVSRPHRLVAPLREGA